MGRGHFRGDSSRPFKLFWAPQKLFDSVVSLEGTGLHFHQPPPQVGNMASTWDSAGERQSGAHAGPEVSCMALPTSHGPEQVQGRAPRPAGGL